MTAQTPTVLKSYFETGDRPTASQYGDFIDTACGYKSYVALLTQSGTAAPTAIVLQNTLGSVSWIRTDFGQYGAVLVDGFTLNKTFLLTQGNPLPGTNDYTIVNVYRQTDSQVTVITSSVDGGSVSLSDDIISNYSLEIRVYP